MNKINKNSSEADMVKNVRASEVIHIEEIKPISASGTQVLTLH